MFGIAGFGEIPLAESEERPIAISLADDAVSLTFAGLTPTVRNWRAVSRRSVQVKAGTTGSFPAAEAAWNFGIASGNLTDATGNGHTGSGVMAYESGLDGKGGALGDSFSTSAANSLGNLSAGGTLAIWAKAGPVGDILQIAVTSESTPDGFRMAISSDSGATSPGSGSIYVTDSAGTGGFTDGGAFNSLILDDGEWHHFLYTWPAAVGPATTSTAKLYVDGNLIASGSVTPANLSGATNPTASVFGDGWHFDEAVIWTRVLSAGQVAQLYLRQTYAHRNVIASHTVAANDPGTPDDTFDALTTDANGELIMGPITCQAFTSNAAGDSPLSADAIARPTEDNRLQAVLVNSLAATSGNMRIGGSRVIRCASVLPESMLVPAAIAGTLTTRTDNDTGVVTVAAGHGITAADTVDLYDADGELVRKDVDVTAVTATTISIDAGTGIAPDYTDLPIATSVINVAKQKILLLNVADASILAWGRELIVPGQTVKGRLLFEDSGGDDILDEVITANAGQSENVIGGDDNSLDNDGGGIAKVTVTQGSPLVRGTFKFLSVS